MDAGMGAAASAGLTGADSIKRIGAETKQKPGRNKAVTGEKPDRNKAETGRV